MKFYVGGTPSVANHGGWLPAGAQTVLLLPGPRAPTLEAFVAYLTERVGEVEEVDVTVGQVFRSGGGTWQPVELTADIRGTESAPPGSAEERRLVDALLAAFAQTFLLGRMEALAPIRSALYGTPASNYRADERPRVVMLGAQGVAGALGLTGGARYVVPAFGVGLVLAAALYWRRTRARGR